ncbi:unnamed protein product [Musa banksii]
MVHLPMVEWRRPHHHRRRILCLRRTRKSWQPRSSRLETKLPRTRPIGTMVPGWDRHNNYGNRVPGPTLDRLRHLSFLGPPQPPTFWGLPFVAHPAGAAL